MEEQRDKLLNEFDFKHVIKCMYWNNILPNNTAWYIDGKLPTSVDELKDLAKKLLDTVIHYMNAYGLNHYYSVQKGPLKAYHTYGVLHLDFIILSL